MDGFGEAERGFCEVGEGLRDVADGFLLLVELLGVDVVTSVLGEAGAGGSVVTDVGGGMTDVDGASVVSVPHPTRITPAAMAVLMSLIVFLMH